VADESTPKGIHRARLDELRPLVDQTPEGHVARLLLAIIDEEIAEWQAHSRKKTLALIRQQGRTDDEAEQIVAAYEAGAPIEMEEVKCWVCEGWGFVQKPGCMGSDSGDCPQCHGHQRASRFKMPESEPREPQLKLDGVE